MGIDKCRGYPLDPAVVCRIEDRSYMENKIGLHQILKVDVFACSPRFQEISHYGQPVQRESPLSDFLETTNVVPKNDKVSHPRIVVQENRCLKVIATIENRLDH